VCPGRRRRSTWLSRVGRPKGNNRPTRSGRQVRRGERAASSNIRFVPARLFSGCRIRHRAPPALPRAQAKRGASEGWSTRAGRKTRTGSCSERRGAPHRRKTSRIVASRFSSRGTVEAVSIHGVSRKPTCDGGGVTSGVTGRQRRSRAGSETASGARVSKKHQRPSARVKYPSSSTHGPPKRVQRVVKRRILRSHRSQGRTKQVGNQGRGYRSGR